MIGDVITGGIAGAVAAVVALQLDIATPQVIAMAVVHRLHRRGDRGGAAQARLDQPPAADLDAAAVTLRMTSS